MRTRSQLPSRFQEYTPQPISNQTNSNDYCVHRSSTYDIDSYPQSKKFPNIKTHSHDFLSDYMGHGSSYRDRESQYKDELMPVAPITEAATQDEVLLAIMIENVDVLDLHATMRVLATLPAHDLVNAKKENVATLAVLAALPVHGPTNAMIEAVAAPPVHRLMNAKTRGHTNHEIDVKDPSEPVVDDLASTESHTRAPPPPTPHSTPPPSPTPPPSIPVTPTEQRPQTTSDTVSNPRVPSSEPPRTQHEQTPPANHRESSRGRSRDHTPHKPSSSTNHRESSRGRSRDRTPHKPSSSTNRRSRDRAPHKSSSYRESSRRRSRDRTPHKRSSYRESSRGRSRDRTPHKPSSSTNHRSRDRAPHKSSSYHESSRGRSRDHTPHKPSSSTNHRESSWGRSRDRTPHKHSSYRESSRRRSRSRDRTPHKPSSSTNHRSRDRAPHKSSSYRESSRRRSRDHTPHKHSSYRELSWGRSRDRTPHKPSSSTNHHSRDRTPHKSSSYRESSRRLSRDRTPHKPSSSTKRHYTPRYSSRGRSHGRTHSRNRDRTPSHRPRSSSKRRHHRHTSYSGERNEYREPHSSASSRTHREDHYDHRMSSERHPPSQPDRNDRHEDQHSSHHTERGHTQQDSRHRTPGSSDVDKEIPQVIGQDAAADVLKTSKRFVKEFFQDRNKLEEAELHTISCTLAITRNIESAARAAPRAAERIGRDVFDVACAAVIISLEEKYDLDGNQHDDRQRTTAPQRMSGTHEGPSRGYASAPIPSSTRSTANRSDFVSKHAAFKDMRDEENRMQSRNWYASAPPKVWYSRESDRMDVDFSSERKFKERDNPDEMPVDDIDATNTPLPEKPVSVPLPLYVPNTSQHRKWTKNDGVHLVSYLGSGTVAKPYVENRDFRGGSFRYYLSFGSALIATPPIPASTYDFAGAKLRVGDVYIHILNDMTEISVWHLLPGQQALASSSKDRSLRVWENISRSFVLNDMSVRHPNDPSFVLAIHINLKPQYLKTSTMQTYIGADKGVQRNVTPNDDLVKLIESLTAGI
ncbi:hypothetical protein BJ165DRAFT_1532053 [Panaeolus papilionaceus]|nr:hypothetical protein BJ165DRAFT_1532053 [Panaeolus papilionaceus]